MSTIFIAKYPFTDTIPAPQRRGLNTACGEPHSVASAGMGLASDGRVGLSAI